MFDQELHKIPATPPRSPALLPGLEWKSALATTTLTTPLVVIGIFFLLFVSVPLSANWHIRHLIGSAAFASATVTDVFDDGRHGLIEILYRFRTSGGQDYPGRARVDRDGGSLYARTKPLESIPIQFVKSHPWENSIVEKGHLEGFLFTLLIPIFFLSALLAPVLIARLLRIYRDRKLFRRGKVVRGTVAFVKPSAAFMWWGWSGASTAEVFVVYSDGPGTEFEARALCQNDWLIRQLAPGTLVHIAYLAKRPSCAMLLDAYER